MLQYHSQSKKQGYINEQARPCFFFMSTVLSRHSERHEHTGENEQPNRKRKRGETTPFDEKKFLTVQLHFLKRLTKMVVQKSKPKEGKPNEQRTSLSDIRFTCLCHGKTREREYPLGG
ncbi:hypothetical protein HMPREF9512_02464 [Enterococcus faecalis EnGen0311]|nr:hypothetical protein HMPREF9512_02464 [Enterococcus faecalis EnGen0311]